MLECLECNDIVALRKETRHCWCGKSEGAYFEDGLYGKWYHVSAWHKGPSRVIGMRNQDRLASRTEPQIAYKTTYPWFVCLGNVEKL